MAQPFAFDVIVQHSSDDANEYAFDESTRAVRLERVVHVSDPAFANRGIVAGAVTPRGEALRAYLISDLPISPQARVAARAVGALEFSRGELLDRVIIVVPLADPRYAAASSFNDLPGPHRAALQRLIEGSAHWLDAQSAEELVHLARQRARLAQVEQRDRALTHPAWETDGSRALLGQLARETDLHTQAEAALFTLPYRFQQYIRLCLTPNERILFWVHRPRFAINRLARITGNLLREGLLLITDQQLLWIVEPVAPSVGVAGYGYLARAHALELLAGVTVESKNHHAILQITSANTLGETCALRIEFPITTLDELAQAARLLNAFVPRPADRRLRRIGLPRAGKIQLDDPMESDHAKTIAVIESLQNALVLHLNCETICAQAFIPGWADGGAKLLTVTDKKVHLTLSSASPFSCDLRAVAATEICFSVLGSWLRLTFPQGKSLEIVFPPTTFKGFNACWLAIRQLSARNGR